MDFLKLFIPGRIIFRSLYWVERERQMSRQLREIFSLIDEDRFAEAEALVAQFRRRWDGVRMPAWVSQTHASVSRAESMLNLLWR